jgi:hypothetical protein
MEKQDREMVSVESYRQLESTCRLWVAACEIRDERLQELEKECQALRQRVARLSRQARRHQGATDAKSQVRFAR